MLCRKDNFTPDILAFGELVADAVVEFEPLAKEKGKTLVASVEKETDCIGDEALLYRLVCILTDNVIKYCDNEGEITAYKKDGTHIGFKVVL